MKSTMTDKIDLECPECGNTDEIPLGASLTITAEMEITVTSIKCGECGYEGEP